MENKIMTSKVVHEWCADDDRWIYIEYNKKGEIVGLNFMQGNDYEYFKKGWCVNDKALMKFYILMLHTFPREKSSVTEVKFINKCMWVFHEYPLL